MNPNQFVVEIKEIERELLDLKTAYTRGLGVANFFEISKDTEIYFQYTGTYVYVAAEFVQQENGVVPYAECYLKNAQYYVPVSIKWNSQNNKLVFAYYTNLSNVSIPFTARIVSSSYVNNISITTGL